MPEESGSNLNINSIQAMIVYKPACNKQDTRHKRPLKASSQLTLSAFCQKGSESKYFILKIEKNGRMNFETESYVTSGSVEGTPVAFHEHRFKIDLSRLNVIDVGTSGKL